VNTTVSTEVKTDVVVTTVTGTVMLVVNLDTDDEIGTSRAPLGRLAVVVTEFDVLLTETGDVVDEDSVATFW
jgi:hypothetical protein